MIKDDVVDELIRITTGSKKKILALHSLLNKMEGLQVNGIDEGDKENMIFLYCFSYYEKFIKDIYNKIFNYINFLKKGNRNYPFAFDNLAFLYPNLGETKTKIRYFNEFKEKMFMEHFSFGKFLKENQKLQSIKHLLKFNTIVSEKGIEEYFEMENYVPIKKEIEEKGYQDKIRLFEEMYKQRNDKMHGSYVMERKEEIEYVFDLFLIAISSVSNSLIDALELKF
ncbi:MAG: hypothetical protein ACRC6E_02595 [Fusobacteriaceae bacterium]